MGWSLGCPVERSDKSSRRRNHVGVPRLVVSREFQSTCLALRSPANRTGNPPPKQAVRSVPINGREGEKEAARIFTGLPANVT